MSDREEAKRLAAAIRKKCRDCCCGMESEIKGCRIKSCPLWEYRCEQKEKTASVRAKGQIGIFEMLKV